MHLDSAPLMNSEGVSDFLSRATRLLESRVPTPTAVRCIERTQQALENFGWTLDW